MSDKLQIIEEAEVTILNDPGEGFQSRDVIYTVAQRLISHTSGKIIGGYDKNLAPVQSPYAGGDLSPQDAMYAVEFALTRGLNPYGHLHLWYQRSNNSPTPQLIIDIDYKVLKGWAEWRSPFRSKAFEMTAEERTKYGLQPGDLGAITYNILDAEVDSLHQYQLQFIKSGLSFPEAQRIAHQAVSKSEGIGVVKAAEMKSSTGKLIPPPKGRTWQWRAETRAFRDAVRRSHGEPPPSQIKQYAAGQGLAISEQHLHLMAESSYPADVSVEDQQQYLKAGDVTEKPEQVHDLEWTRQVMNNNGDDDPLELAREDQATEDPPPPPKETDNEDEGAPDPKGMAASTEFWKYINSISMGREEAGIIIRDNDGDFIAALKAAKATQEKA